jgi:hypothetical protein
LAIGDMPWLWPAGIGAGRARGSLETPPPLWMVLRMSSKPMSAS